MRSLSLIVLTIALVYSVLWFVAAEGARRSAVAALDGLRADGWDVEVGEVAIQGFPNRIDTTLAPLRLTSPAGAFNWDTPFFQVFALSYRPNRVLAIWPAEQRLFLAGQEITVAADRLRASAHLGIAAALPLDQVTVESGPLQVTGATGWRLSADRLLAAARRSAGLPNGYDLFAEVTVLTLPDPLRQRADPAGTRPAALQDLRLDATATLDRPLDRHLADPVRMTALSVREGRLTWGAMQIVVRGELRFDPAGRATGDMTLTLADPRGLVDLGLALGVLGPEEAGAVALGIAGLGGAEATLALPLTIADGQVSLGPVPLGLLPPLW